MAGCETLRADLPGHAQKRLELHFGVAIGAGDGRAAGEILIHEGTHHAGLELFLEVHDIMRKIQMTRDVLGVVHIVERTATVLRGAVSLKFGEAALIPELHRQPHDGMTLLLEKRGHRRRIHATGHGNGDQS
jgi:hypothetical protein